MSHISNRIIITVVYYFELIYKSVVAPIPGWYDRKWGMGQKGNFGCGADGGVV